MIRGLELASQCDTRRSPRRELLVSMNDVLTTTLKVVRMNTLADSLAFCSYKGIPYRSFRSACELAGRKAGFENFTVHDLRRTLTSCLVMAGVDFPTV